MSRKFIVSSSYCPTFENDILLLKFVKLVLISSSNVKDYFFSLYNKFVLYKILIKTLYGFCRHPSVTNCMILTSYSSFISLRRFGRYFHIFKLINTDIYQCHFFNEQKGPYLLGITVTWINIEIYNHFNVHKWHSIKLLSTIACHSVINK